MKQDSATNTVTAATARDMLEALEGLVCCPAFTGALFQTDKASHRAWTLAGLVIDTARDELD